MNFPSQKMFPILLPAFLIIALLLFMYQIKKDDVPSENPQLLQESGEPESPNASSSDSIGTTTDIVSTPPAKVTPTTPPVSKTNTLPVNTPLTSESTTKELQLGDYVNEVFAGGTSERCEWVDPTSGEEGLALIKDGKVRTETTSRTKGTVITIYNSVATYVWVKGEEEGTIVLRSLEADASIDSYQSRSEIAEYLKTNERVTCHSSALGDSHFIPPSDVTFLQFKI